MNIATLRASGTEEAIRSLRSALGLKIDCEWEKGDVRRRGKIHETSGFNVCVADFKNSKDLMLAIREFLLKCRSAGMVFSSEGLAAELDIGVAVGSEEQFTASLLLTADDTRICSEIGLPIRVSAYPASN